MKKAFTRYREMNPEQQQALREKFRNMTPEQRRELRERRRRVD
jgi:hypothetical protein